MRSIERNETWLHAYYDETNRTVIFSSSSLFTCLQNNIRYSKMLFRDATNICLLGPVREFLGNDYRDETGHAQFFYHPLSRTISAVLCKFLIGGRRLVYSTTMRRSNEIPINSRSKAK